MDKKLLDILVCPVSKAPLQWFPEQQELICTVSRLAYPVRDGIPVMLESEARCLEDGEVLGQKRAPTPNSAESDPVAP